MFDALVHTPAANALCAGVDPRTDPTLLHKPRALGLHPAQVDEGWPEALTVLEDRLRSERCAALGECGLDARADLPDLALQVEAFRHQLDLAKKLNLPVVIHLVRATERALELIEARAPVRGFIHGYSGPAELVARWCAAGLHLSFGRLLLNPRARRAREAAVLVPEGRLLVETDAPDLEPARLGDVIAALAELRGEAAEHVEAVTEANARALLSDQNPAANP
jgi:TatD DNase family protein